jgi:hypothetical protein
MNKSLVFFLTVIAAGLGAIIYAEANTISELNRKMTELRAKEGALRAQSERDREEIARLQSQIATFRDESEALRKKLASGPSAGAASAPGANALPAAAAGDSKGAWGKNFAKMFSDPEMKKSMKAQQSMGIRMMYGDLFKQLGLSAQDAEQLADILAERQMEFSAAAMAGMNGENKPDPEQSNKIADAKKAYEEQLKATLGEANYKKLQDYEKTMGDRFMMQQYDGQFASAGAPLEPKQRESLLQIMQDERLKMKESPFTQNNTDPQAALEAIKDPAAVDRFFAQQEEMNRRVLDRARQTLSADQIGALQKIQQQMAEMMRGQMKMSQELFGK